MTTFNDNDLEKKLENMKPKPLTQEEKNLMWSKIEQKIGSIKTVEKSPSRGIPSPFSTPSSFFVSVKSFTRKVVVIPLLFVLILGGGTVAAADNAKPGDLLFPIDLTIENVRLAFSDSKNKGVLKVKFAEERFAEAKEILNIIEENNEVTLHLAINAATSTPNNTDATSTATSTNQNNASSTDDRPDKSGNKKYKKATGNFLVAIRHLEKTKKYLEDLGDTEGVLRVENIIADLTGLTEERLALIDDLDEIDDEIKAKIKEDRERLIIDVRDLREDFRRDFEEEREEIREKIEEEREEMEEKREELREKAKDEREKMKEERDRMREEIDKKRDKIDEERKKVKDWFDFGRHDDEDHDEDGDHHEDDDDDHDEDEDGDDDHHYNGYKKTKVCHEGRTLEISKSALYAHINHGDTKGECNDDDGGDDNEPLPDDTTAPVISAINSLAGTTTAEISWSTDEGADSKVWYSTTTPLSLEDSLSVESSATTTNHNLNLSGLKASTTHYFMVVSTDDSGNTATSTENSFTTLPDVITPAPDTESPILSSITALNTATSTATISWDTDEPATSKVWYSTTTPLVASDPTPMVQDSSLLTSHSLELTNLATSTTYYYVVVSSDDAENTATSTELSFAVTP